MTAAMSRRQPIEPCLCDALTPCKPRLVVLFGSMAREDAKPDSDLDIAILTDGPLCAQKRIEIVDALALVSGRAVDLVDLHSVGEPLLGRILAEGRRIMGSTLEWGQLLSRHLHDQADFVPLQNYILRTRREAWIRQ